MLRLRKLDAGYDPARPHSGDEQHPAAACAGEVVTGLLYVDSAAGDLHSHLDTVAAPLNSLARPN